MSNDPVQPGAAADDLLGRWFAHHDKATDDKAAKDQAAEDPVTGDAEAPSPRRLPLAARLSEAAAQPMTRPSAAATLAELRAPAADVPDSPRTPAPPSAFGTRRGLPGSVYSGPTGPPQRGVDGDIAELDRPAPAGFEPVILRSVRKKSEVKDEEKDKKGRLSRLRSRVAGPIEEPDPTDDDAPTLPPDEAIAAAPSALVEAPAPTPAPAATTPPPPPPPAPAPAPASPPRQALPLEEVIALATRASLPVREPEVEPEPEPVLPDPEPEIEIESVLPDPEPEIEIESVLPGPDPEPEPVDDRADDAFGHRRIEDRLESALPADDEPTVPTTRRRLVTRTKRPEPAPTEERKRRPAVPRHASAPTTGSAARGLLAAARAATPATPPGVQSRPAVTRPEPTPVPVPVPVETAVTAPAPSATEMPAIYQFVPMKSVRRFLSLMLVTGLATSGYLGYGAYQSRETIHIGVAVIVTLATLVIWAIRAGATVTRLTVRRGQLEISRQGGRMVFDLASTYTSIEVVGQPGRKNWKVLFHRRGMSPVAVDSTMVDAHDFMRVLRFFRPGIGQADTTVDPPVSSQ